MTTIAKGIAFKLNAARISEQERLAALKSLNILNTPPDPRLDRLTRLAQATSKAPLVLISLVDEDRLWFKSRQGCGLSQAPRCMSFCDVAMAHDGPLIVQDATHDPRFRGNPLVVGEPHIKFYAGWPLRLSTGVAIGTLCVLDYGPRLLSQDQQEQLADLASAAATTIELMRDASYAIAQRGAVQATRAYYRAIFDSVVDPLAVYDPIRDAGGQIVDFELRRCNAAAASLRGNTADELVGQKLRALVPNLPESKHEAYRAVIENGASIEFEHHYKDDFYNDWFRVRASRTKDNALLLQLSVLTEQKEREESLQRSRDALNSFASVVSHDLRTPLGHISGFTEILQNDLGDSLSQQHQDYMGYIIGGADHMRRLIDALQRHAKLGEVEVERECIDLNTLVAKLKHRYETALSDTGSTLEWGTLDSVSADPVLLDQLLSNLLGNAIRYRSMDRPLCVRIATRETARNTLIEVKDNGKGISAADQQSIFTLFCRGANAGANDDALGLGLATCRTIAQAHGGSIRLTSQEGSGSSFLITLPRG